MTFKFFQDNHDKHAHKNQYRQNRCQYLHFHFMRRAASMSRGLRIFLSLVLCYLFIMASFLCFFDIFLTLYRYTFNTSFIYSTAKDSSAPACFCLIAFANAHAVSMQVRTGKPCSMAARLIGKVSAPILLMAFGVLMTI